MTAELTSLPGILAIVAVALSLAGVVIGIVALTRLRQVGRAQRLVLGDSGERDLVAHAERIERDFHALRDWSEQVLGQVDGRLGAAEGAIAGTIAHRALIRYDAYGEMSGRQSSSVALLDRHRSGVVISSILHRDQARVYVKQIHDGTSDLDLSPEEIESIEAALGSTAG